MPPKRNVRKNPRRKATRTPSYMRYIPRRTVVYDDEVWEQPAHSHQTCLSCYMTYEFDWNMKFDIRNRFCVGCRRSMPFKKWLLLRKFYRMLEDALNKREPDNDVTRGSVMQYVNSCYQSLRHNKSREFLLESISCTVEVGHLGNPIELSQLMEIYDQVTGAKKKRRTAKKRRHLQRRRKIV